MSVKFMHNKNIKKLFINVQLSQNENNFIHMKTWPYQIKLNNAKLNIIRLPIYMRLLKCVHYRKSSF